MSREILWYHAAVEDIQKLSVRNSRRAGRILLAVRDFGRTNAGDIKKLKASDESRLRVGDWRIFLQLVGPIAYVVAVTDRQDAY